MNLLHVKTQKILIIFQAIYSTFIRINDSNFGFGKKFSTSKLRQIGENFGENFGSQKLYL